MGVARTDFRYRSEEDALFLFWEKKTQSEDRRENAVLAEHEVGIRFGYSVFLLSRDRELVAHASPVESCMMGTNIPEIGDNSHCRKTLPPLVDERYVALETGGCQCAGEN